MLGHKIILNKFEKIGIIKSIFSEQMEWSYKAATKKTEKIAGMWKLNNTLLSNQWVKEEITRELWKCIEMKMKIQYTKVY